MTLDGESYDPFSAETLKVLAPNHPSYRQRVIDASRRKYAIPMEMAQKLIEEEESQIIRSAQEKAAITKKGKNETGESSNNYNAPAAPEKDDNAEPLI